MREKEAGPSQSFLQKVFSAAGITITILVILIFLIYTLDFLMILFAGALLAIFLHGLGDWLRRHSGLPGGASLAIVLFGILALSGVSWWLLAPDVAKQVDELLRKLPGVLQRLQGTLTEYEWGRRLLDNSPRPDDLIPGDPGEMVSRATGVFSKTFGLIGGLLVILFTGLFLAMDPGAYIDGFLKLFPVRKRARMKAVIGEVGGILRGWLMAKILSMAIVGFATTVGLWLIGIPLALTLGLFAAVLAFIPNVGPVLGAIPAVLIALVEGPRMALYVVLLYTGIQTVESYLITPLLQKRIISLPPAFTLAAQVLLTVFLGALGIFLATPLAAAGVVLVRMLYVEDVLGDKG